MTRIEDIACGIYRATVAIGDSVPAGALVYYHNHGDPGPGVYLPREWRLNRAVFHERGTTVPDVHYPLSLEPLLPEGLYRVVAPFDCCERQCQHFEEDLLVQLGYNGKAQPILFVPELIDGALGFPATGALVDEETLARLQPLKVRMGPGPKGHGN
jgi:hypothetical protein